MMTMKFSSQSEAVLCESWTVCRSDSYLELFTELLMEFWYYIKPSKQWKENADLGCKQHNDSW